MPFSLLDAESSPLHRLQLISLALQQSTVEPPLARKLSEARSSPLWLEADLQCWCWPGLPSFSKNSSQLDACSLLHPNSSHALCHRGMCRLCRAAGCTMGLNSLCRRGWGRHTEDNNPCYPGHALAFCSSVLMKWIFVSMHAQVSVSLS